jgi:sugar lactone lactonase YvrE
VASFIGSVWPCSALLAATCLLSLDAAMYAQTVHFGGGQSTLPTGKLNFPESVAVDAGGNLYILDAGTTRVLKETPSGGVYTQSTIAQLPPVMYSPSYGIAVDAIDNLYIADTNQNEVLKETPSAGGYIQSTIVSSPSVALPNGIAVDSRGNVYSNNRNGIVKETPSGGAYTQSPIPTIALSYPYGLAVDPGGNIYIADPGQVQVLEESPSGGSYTESTVVAFTSAEKLPQDVAVDAGGNVYIVLSDEIYPNHDNENNDVLKETPSAGGYVQSTVASSGLNRATGIALDAKGNVYIGDSGNNRVVKLQQGAADFGPVNVRSTSLPISMIFTFDVDGTLGAPLVLTQGGMGLDFVDAGTGSCTTNGTSHLYAAGDICTIDVLFKPRFAGTRYGAAVLQDSLGNALASGYVYGTGVGPQATFPPGTPVPVDSGLVNPFGLAVDAVGDVFFAESGSGAVYKDTPSGGTYVRTLIAGGLNHPTGVAVDGLGNVYIAASGSLFKETLSHGAYSQSEIVSDLSQLVGVAVDRGGNLYLTGSASGDVRKETLQANGSYTETAIGYGITHPTGVAVDGSGNVYITDVRQGDVYKETLATNGSYIQATIAGGFSAPESVSVDGTGNLYITDSSRGEVYKETLQAGGSYIQTVAATGLNQPWWIAVDGRGNLYLSHDGATGDLAMIDVADPPALSFAKTAVGSTSTDSPQLVTVSNIGNAALAFPVPGSGANPGITPSFTLGGATTCPEVSSSDPAGSVNPASSCVYAIDFIPATSGPVSGSLVLTDTNLNAVGPGYVTQRIALRSGTTSDTTRTTLRIAPDPVKEKKGVTFIVTVTDTTTLSTVPQGGVVTFAARVNGNPVSLNGLAPVPLSGGRAVLNLIPDVPGAYGITAHYAGVDGKFTGSTAEGELTVEP